MALVRCSVHPIDKRLVKNNYVAKVKPLGSSSEAVICGRIRCTNSGLVWLTDKELEEFHKGNRIFSFVSRGIKVRVSNELLPLPIE